MNSLVLPVFTMTSKAFHSFPGPRNMGMYSDYLFDRLTRCDTCRLKYDQSHLKQQGHLYICKFCLKQKLEIVQGIN